MDKEKLEKQDGIDYISEMEIVQGQRILKRGYTSGTSAAAAARYSLMLLAESLGDYCFEKTFKQIEVKNKENETILYRSQVLKLRTPSGIIADVELKPSTWDNKGAEDKLLPVKTWAIKDSGDDPDVTHRAEIAAQLSIEGLRTSLGQVRDYLYIINLNDYSFKQINTLENEEVYKEELAANISELEAKGLSFIFIALAPGQGVGVVTKKGLAPSLYHGAINPVPRKMLVENLLEVIKASPLLQKKLEGTVLRVEISVKNGEKLAEKTFNPKLGIKGGISILGTSGIVEPMSEKALVDTIKTELKQFLALNKEAPLLICPGNYGQDYIKTKMGIDIGKSVKVSNFIGDALDYMVYLGIREVLFVGHAGKLIKLAASIMNTHSHYADGRAEILASHGAINGASRESLKKIMEGISVEEMLEALLENGQEIFEATMESIKKSIRRNLDHRTRSFVRAEFVVFTSDYGMIIKSEKADEYARRIREEK